MITLCAFLSTLAGAWLVLQSRRRAVTYTHRGGLMIVAGTTPWLMAEGTGAGIAAVLTTPMLT